ncbi:MAG: hypothetical protein D6729_05545 [Deltaproteobacteria bacterium]|nr:MAG: hypothetical protein D6729_05545 [Deltaproteobacteria bacterium]
MPACPACNAEVAPEAMYCPECLAEIPTDDIVGDEEIAEYLSESAITGKPTGFYGVVQCPKHPDELPLGQCPRCERYICEICMPDIRRRRPEEMICEACEGRAALERAPEELCGLARELAFFFLGYGVLVMVFSLVAPFLGVRAAVLPFGPATGAALGLPLALDGLLLLFVFRPVVAWVGVALQLFVTVYLGVLVAATFDSGRGLPLKTWLLSAGLLLTFLPPIYSAVRTLKLTALRADLAGEDASARSGS